MGSFDMSVRSCECTNCNGEDFPYLDEYYLLRFGVTEEEANPFIGNWISSIILREHYVEGKMEIIGETEHLYFVNLLDDVVGLSGSDAKDFIRDLLGE